MRESCVFRRLAELEDVEQILSAFVYLPVLDPALRRAEWLHQSRVRQLVMMSDRAFHAALDWCHISGWLTPAWMVGAVRSHHWQLTESGKGVVS